MHRKALIFAIAMGLIAGGIGYAAMRFFEPAQDEAIQYAPADSFFYANVFLSPSTSQKRALEDLLEKFPGVGTTDEALDALERLFDEGLREAGLTFAEDVEPWLGQQVALFFQMPAQLDGDPDGALLIATDDGDASLDTFRTLIEHETDDVEDASYEGVDYIRATKSSPRGAAGVVGDFLVVGTENGFKAAVDAHDGESLGDTEKFQTAERDLAEDRLAFLYFDLQPFFELAQTTGQIPPGVLPEGLLGGFERPLTISLGLRSDAIVFESSSGLPPVGSFGRLLGLTAEPGNLADLPGNAWAAFSLPNLGESARGVFDLVAGSGVVGGFTRAAAVEFVRAETGLDLDADLFAWLGDVGLFVQGTDQGSLGGGAVVSSLDPAASARAFTRFELLMRRNQAPVEPLSIEGVRGFSVKDVYMPEAISFVDAGDRLLAVYGGDATRDAIASSPTLSESALFGDARRALGPDFSPQLFVDFASVLELADNSGASSDPFYAEEIKPFLEPIAFVVSGTKALGDTLLSRFVIGIP